MPVGSDLGLNCLQRLSADDTSKSRVYDDNSSKGSLTVWALYAYFSDSQNAAFELLVWCM